GPQFIVSCHYKGQNQYICYSPLHEEKLLLTNSTAFIMRIRHCFTLLLLFATALTRAQSVPTPKEHFGFNIGDDYQLATYTQTEAYFKKLDEASDRVKMVSMGLTEEGRNQWMLIVTSPENHKNLDKYKAISQKLAHAEDLTEEQARALAAEGKAIIW